MDGAPTPPPPGAETPISGSAGDEEPQHHFGATSGIRIAKMKGKGSEEGQSNNLEKVLWMNLDPVGFLCKLWDCPESRVLLFY